MGFDLNILCSINLCSTTGKPYYLQVQDGEIRKVYGMPEITVPAEFRKFLHQNGDYFHAYTTSRVDPAYASITEMSVLSFLDQFPEWMDVLIDVNYHKEDGWTKEDHLSFKKALHWFSDQPVDYIIRWSY